MHQKEALHSFHPQLPPNTIWGFDGILPGPTFHSKADEPILVRIYNDLPLSRKGFGSPETITHLHNAHTASESDGYPGDFYPPGQYKDHHYANFCAGNDDNESLHTLWYHDHRMDFTSQNVYKGLAGFHLRYDELDSGNEEDPNPGALRMPSGEYDIPLMIADKRFDSSGQLFFDPFEFDGLLGDKYTVNGKIQPFFKVARRKYRFRILNASASRFYEFFLSSGAPFVLVANDGNLLAAPYRTRSIRIAPAERVDVIIDFKQYKRGEQVFLVNRLEQKDGRGPEEDLLDRGTEILRFDVDRVAPDPSQIPLLLRPQPEVDLTRVTKRRTWEFERTNGSWAINDELFDVDEPRALVKQGATEIWTLRNNSGGWSHPIHIHLEEFQILTRNGRKPPVHERGRKDVVVVGPNEEVRVYLKFRDLLGRYVMHCHNTVHEDHAMMLRWDVVP
ncbi:MAG: hypothetical protein EOP84_03565 [Verrucomicrobiaceae bacterium]|nr:MAG: hypothetical protein EOP84_03565 [Verrucomicrobiaceae bacterium]